MRRPLANFPPPARTYTYNPDLEAFKAGGGKAIVYQGYADAAAIPEITIGYYEDVRATMGGQAATDEFLRLFLIPGAGHCFEPPRHSPDHFDPIAALEAWVEDDTAPDSMRRAFSVARRSRESCRRPTSPPSRADSTLCRHRDEAFQIDIEWCPCCGARLRVTPASRTPGFLQAVIR